MISIMFTP